MHSYDALLYLSHWLVQTSFNYEPLLCTSLV